jgi:hypothetical protein
MFDVAVTPELRKLDKRLSSNNFGWFIPTIPSRIRDSGVSRNRMDPAVA